MRELSSSMTFFYKFIFPTLWIGGFASVTLAMFLAPDRFKGSADIREMRWLFTGATVIGSAGIYWACMRLKKVTLQGSSLFVSNYRREIEIPLRDVEAISGSLFMSPELIWLRTRRPTELGSKIVFMPKGRLSFGFSRHPLVRELRALASDPGAHA